MSRHTCVQACGYDKCTSRQSESDLRGCLVDRVLASQGIADDTQSRVFIVAEEVESKYVLMCKNRNKGKMKDDQGANVVQKEFKEEKTYENRMNENTKSKANAV